MSRQKVKNTTGHPVDSGADGGQIPAGEFGMVDPEDPTAAAAIEAGHLVPAAGSRSPSKKEG